MPFTDTFSGSQIAPSAVSYLALALTANATLTWPLEALPNGVVAAAIIDVTPTGTFTVTMPDARLASPGSSILFNNIGPNTVTVTSATGTTLLSVTSGTAWQLYLRDNTTRGGLWRSVQFGASVSQAQAASLAGFGITAVGATLAQGQPVTLFTSNFTAGAPDRASLYVWAGTGTGILTLPAAAGVGDGWYLNVRNGGGGNLTLAAQGSDAINGSSTLVLLPGDSAVVATDGTNFYTIGLGQQSIFAFDYTLISLAALSGTYTLSGTELNRIAYKFSGALTGDVSVVMPTTTQQYWVDNSTTGGSFLLKIGTVGQSPFLTVPRGSRGIYYSNGSVVIKADTASIATPISIADGGTGTTTAGGALINLGGTSVGIGVFTAVTATAARAALGAAASGANTDITSIVGLTLTNPLVVGSGGSGVATLTGIPLYAGTAAVTAAAAGTDYAKPNTVSTWTAKQTFNGAATVPAMKLLNALEAVTTTGTAVAAVTINFDLSTQSVLWYNVNATANPTAVNFRLSSGTSLDAAMAVGESMTACMLIKNGATAYFLNTSRLTVDTSGTVTVLWQVVQPTSGGINSTDIYSFVITKTAAATWTIFASQAAFV